MGAKLCGIRELKATIQTTLCHIYSPYLFSAFDSNCLFYWHLGDFRHGNTPDRDFVILNGGPDNYHKRAWDDFVERQIAPIEARTQVFLGIGNHELVFPWWGHEEFNEKFGKWLIQEPIRARFGRPQ